MWVDSDSQTPRQAKQEIEPGARICGQLKQLFSLSPRSIPSWLRDIAAKRNVIDCEHSLLATKLQVPTVNPGTGKAIGRKLAEWLAWQVKSWTWPLRRSSNSN